MSRTLRPEDQIAHYKVVSALASGGMGEVYLAQDQTLERSVALKILPPELVKNEERVRRFVREAKSASSLNHPNIVTIYEIGEGNLAAVGDEPTSESIHFISMELVSGETLSEKIHHEKTDLRTLLGYLAQAAEGVAKAHAAGIVHRDLKPSNIMINRDGFAKVLDFGLAKLTERQEASEDMTAAATLMPETDEGTVMGTVGYMSPEQVRGRTVDLRSDIFSFGCILYECVTRKRPFVADSNVEVMHKILHESPIAVEELNPDAPREVRRLIKRCLARNPEQRFQSIKDLAIELQEIVDEYETLSPSGSSVVSSPSESGLHAQVGGRRIPTALIVGIGLVGLVGLAFGLMTLLRGSEEPLAPMSSEAVEMESVIAGNSLGEAVLSPDAKYLAYTRFVDGQSGIWMRQLATGSDVEVVPAGDAGASSLTFSPDGNYLYFRRRDPEARNYSALFEVPSLGGQPRKRIFDVDTAISFSPDGTQACFRRGFISAGEEFDSLILANLTTNEERVLAKAPLVSFATPRWSPDGKHIVTLDTRRAGRFQLLSIDVSSGSITPLGPEWLVADTFCWLADGSALLLSAFHASNIGPGLWRVSYPDGEFRLITQDTNDYFGIESAANSGVVSLMRRSRAASVWTLSLETGGEPRQLSEGTARSGSVGSFCVTDDGSIIADMFQDGSLQIYRLDTEGASHRALTSGGLVSFGPFWVPERKVILFNGFAEGSVHVWSMDPDGGGLRQLTFGEGFEFHGNRLLPDGSFVYRTQESEPSFYAGSLDGGEPTLLHEGSEANISPDGSMIQVSEFREVDGRQQNHYVVLDLKSREERAAFRLDAQQFDLEWAPKSDGFTVIRRGDASRSLEFIPLSGGESRILLQISDARLVDHTWAPDGSQLMLSVRQGQTQTLRRADPDGSNLRSVTDFRTGEIFDYGWSADGKSLYFTHGNTETDVVLIRNVQ